MKKLTLFCTINFILLSIANVSHAKMKGEKCKWKVSYEADGYSSQDLDDGIIVGEGFAKWKFAPLRYDLSFTAVKRCLESSLNEANPKACSRSKKKGKGGKYRVHEFSLGGQPLKKTVFNYLCERQKKKASAKKITGIKIYTVYAGKDPFCKKDGGKKSGIETIAKGLSVNCDAEGDSQRENKEYKNRVSNWHNTSASKVKKKVKAFCHKKFGMKGKPKFGDFEIKKKSGEIRVNYTCKN